MVYVILDDANKDRVILVKGNDRDAVKARINLSETERVVSGFTDREIASLDTSRFTVVSNL